MSIDKKTSKGSDIFEIFSIYFFTSSSNDAQLKATPGIFEDG
jgi:hypothetical protein